MVKFQCNVIKNMEKEKKARYFWDINDILITFDNSRCVRIPKSRFYLDTALMDNYPSLEKIMTLKGEEFPAVVTKQLVEDGKMKMRIVKDSNGSIHYINEKHMKELIYKNYDFLCTEKGLYCCINNEVIEFICFIRKRN